MGFYRLTKEKNEVCNEMTGLLTNWSVKNIPEKQVEEDAVQT